MQLYQTGFLTHEYLFFPRTVQKRERIKEMNHAISMP